MVDAQGKVRLFAYPQDTAELSDLAVHPSVRQEATDRLRQSMKRLGISWDVPPEKWGASCTVGPQSCGNPP